MKIAENSTVTIDYTMTLDNGEVVDSTKDTDPLTYTQGEGELIAGIEKRMTGLTNGDTLEVILPPEEGFGDVDPEAFIEIPKTDLPPEALQVDAQLQGEGPQGQAIEGRVVELKETSALVDFNHPLAGKNLHFTVTVVDVK
ncbi:MAG: peptidylprolyl isomerase [Desulfobulbus sp.]|nr:MAG: peptidylprolyl isomerase [Desulfobulbus sp.]RUM39544.1 MAG: peptidylprolyl isomerase [Desulfobulbus sp.]RUM41258.1 MAG: peptidylprolyl isomerase [Desulfobulbus sp.]